MEINPGEEVGGDGHLDVGVDIIRGCESPVSVVYLIDRRVWEVQGKGEAVVEVALGIRVDVGVKIGVGRGWAWERAPRCCDCGVEGQSM